MRLKLNLLSQLPPKLRQLVRGSSGLRKSLLLLSMSSGKDYILSTKLLCCMWFLNPLFMIHQWQSETWHKTWSFSIFRFYRGTGACGSLDNCSQDWLWENKEGGQNDNRKCFQRKSTMGNLEDGKAFYSGTKVCLFIVSIPPPHTSEWIPLTKNQ